jgi:hypothetical protein
MSVYDSGAVAWRDYPAIFTLPLSIANGGTGQTTQTAAFDALSPDTTKGDLIVNDGTNSVRLAVASNDYSTIIARAGATPGLEWRDRTELVTIFAHPTQVPWTPGAAYAPFQSSSSECSLTRSFKPYREARIIVRGKLTIGSTQVDVKIVDTTNSQNMTGIVSFTSTTISTMVGTWTALNSATYAGDAAFEAQAIETVAGDSLRVNMIALELR